MPRSRTPSYLPSRRPSRASSVGSVGSGVDLADNLSFVSHLSSLGRGTGGGADLETIVVAAAAITNHADSLVASGAAAQASSAPVDGEDILVSEDVSFTLIIKQFFFTGYPLTISTLSQFSLNVVIVSVIGRFLGVKELGGASLALGLINATGFAFGAGLCGALETVLSHTFGSYERQQQLEEQRVIRVDASPSDRAAIASSPAFKKDAKLYMYGTYAQRMAIILFVASFPLGFILSFADALLAKLGESREVLYYTGIWCRVGLFGIPATLAFQLVQRYYSCQKITKPLSVAMITAALANPVLQIVFVKLFGFYGSPIAWLLLMTCVVAGLIGYLRYTGLHKLSWGGWSRKSVQNIGSLVNIALPSMGVTLSEWVALEVNALAAGFGEPNELAAFSITLQVFGVMWGFASGVMILTCVFVGNAVGAGKPRLARRIALTSILLVLVISVLDCVVIFLLGPFIPYLFTTEREVADLYHRLMYVVLPYHLFDTFQSTVMGILRGCELQKIGAILISIVFCAVGIPCSFLLYFYFDIGVIALWIGPFFGVATVGLPAYLYLLLRYIDWDRLQPHKEEVVLSEVEDSEEGPAEAYSPQMREYLDGTVGVGRGPLAE